MLIFDYERGFPNPHRLLKLGVSRWFFAKTCRRGSVASCKVGCIQHFEPVVRILLVIK